jgi:hypothetical protein
MNYATDPVFQAVQHIRHPAHIEPILEQSWEHWIGEKPQSIQIKPILTYYRPRDRAHIVSEMRVTTTADSEPILMHLFFNAFADAEAARQQLEQGYVLAVPPNAALPAFAITDWQTVVWTLPHAPCLQELTNLLQPESFCPLLISPADLPADPTDYPAPQIFRYVPFKRAILTWDSVDQTQRYFVKLCSEKEFPTVVANFQEIYAQSDHLSFAVPEPVTADANTRTFSMRALPGEQFTTIMRQTQPGPFVEVGRLLTELHQAKLYPAKVWTPQKELNTLAEAMADVKMALPQLSPSIDAAIAQFTAVAKHINFPKGCPIHANLFGDQILYGADRIGMVDWDTLSLGDPHYDIGRLIAHFLYLAGREALSLNGVKLCIEALLTGYETQGSILDPQCLTWHVSMQLLLRGKISSLRKLPTGWQSHLEFVVAESEWIREGCSEYVSLPALKLSTVAI